MFWGSAGLIELSAEFDPRNDSGKSYNITLTREALDDSHVTPEQLEVYKIKQMAKHKPAITLAPTPAAPVNAGAVSAFAMAKLGLRIY